MARQTKYEANQKRKRERAGTVQRIFDEMVAELERHARRQGDRRGPVRAGGGRVAA